MHQRNLNGSRFAGYERVLQQGETKGKQARKAGVPAIKDWTTQLLNKAYVRASEAWLVRRGLLVGTIVLLAGCFTSPDGGSGLENAPVPAALPAPIHDEQEVVASTSARTLMLPCGDGHACYDYPFELPRKAVINAQLNWSAYGNAAALRIFQDDAIVDSEGFDHTSRTVGSTTVRLETTLAAGRYVLRVDAVEMAGDRFVLDVTFLEPRDSFQDAPVFAPHVLIGIPDTGINPYHEAFYRPELTEHPCTYIRNMPCDTVALPLSLGLDNWNEAVNQDRSLWEGIEVGKWYWIPQTVFVAVHCSAPEPDGNFCILDDVNPHGALTTSILVRENPDAYLAFSTGPSIRFFEEARLPVDLYSVSYASTWPAPIPAEAAPCSTADPTPVGALGGPVWSENAPLYFQGAGNFAWHVSLNCWMGHPRTISIGAGYTAPNGIDATSGNGAELVSFNCPPYAAANQVAGIDQPGSRCGTSLATPTVAGAVSKVILQLRQSSGYDGNLTGGTIDAILGVTASQLRDAINRTATYNPHPKHSSAPTAIPLNSAMPWLQWGWGFYDADLVNATVQHLLGTQPAPEKPEAAREYMATVNSLNKALYG